MTTMSIFSAAGRGAWALRFSAVLFAAMSIAMSGSALAQDARGEPEQEQPAQEQPQEQPPKAADEEKETKPVEAKLVYTRMSTSMGDIIIELNREKAPITVDNFLRYINEKFFDNTIFHRVLQNFVIQGGGFTEDMTKKSVYEGIKNEWENGLKNLRGTLSMARVGGRPDSGSSQFFVSLRDNASLDQKQPDGAAYAVFGKVVAGMDVVDAIAAVPVEASAQNPREKSKPVTNVVMKSVRVIDADEAANAIKGEAAKEMSNESNGTEGR